VAIIAASLPGGTPIPSHAAPDFLRNGEALPFSPDLPALAVRALDRVVNDNNSEWAGLWNEETNNEEFAELREEAFEQVAQLRSVLSGAGQAPTT